MKAGDFAELLRRYGHALTETAPLAAAVIGGAVLLTLPHTRRFLAERRAVSVALLALVAAGGLWWAWQLRWVCDDAFISFRYAQNLVDGHGLVWNPGERVEGYTNFLWTLLVAAFIPLGLHPGQTAVVLSLASFVGLLILLARLARRLAKAPAAGGTGSLRGLPENGKAVGSARFASARLGGALIGLGPILAAASYTMATFATSGLETMFAATLTLASLELAEARRPTLAGLLAVLATMSHPDHAIFYAALGAALLTFRDRRLEVARYAVPFVFVYVPYFFWRWRYYGDLFPNTFYAKSADKTYFSQGAAYLAVTLVGSGLWACLPLAAVGAHRFRNTLTARFAMIALPLFVVYIAKIGGDFMMGRLLVPAIALVFLLADVGLRAVLQTGPLAPAMALAALAGVAALPTKVIAPGEKPWHIADERTFYGLRSFDPLEVNSGYQDQGRSLHDALTARGLKPRVAVGCVGVVGFVSKLPIVDMFGLNNRYIARMPLAARGRPGHEKLAQAGHILHEGAELSEFPVLPEPWSSLGAVTIGGVRYYLVRHDAKLVAGLKTIVEVPDVGRHLDESIDRLAANGPHAMACDLAMAADFYFSRTYDPGRRDRLIARAVESDSTLRGLEPLLLDPSSPSTLGYRAVRRFSFARNESWAATGDAFAAGPVAATPLGQQEVFGATGAFADSFTTADKDAATGTLRSAPFTIEGDVMTLKVGGGLDANRMRVALVVEGTAVRIATGCNNEILTQRAWNLAGFRGQRAYLEVVDDSRDDWGHVMADEITEWRSPADGRHEP